MFNGNPLLGQIHNQQKQNVLAWGPNTHVQPQNLLLAGLKLTGGAAFGDRPLQPHGHQSAANSRAPTQLSPDSPTAAKAQDT